MRDLQSQIETRADRELEIYEEALRNGEISIHEYNEAVREIQYEARGAYQEDREVRNV